MEQENNKAYLKAKKKVETLKAFYNHLAVYCIINLILILIHANVFSKSPVDFTSWGNYVGAFFWGIGLVSHGLYVLYIFYAKQNVFQKWEEKKIQELLNKQDEELNNTQYWE
ncbi:2TM domain-containing protein [Cochleicola gelatinilyticus]|uniref:2TM domain-containing protein n=1 Tax=Cochleicola gelatinilyticus TaxID=1763537 RepID=A0A167HQV5_9FLAO|nr:2TM domain-containing protein [Cochleicola gelatinilyticus]OAB78871.1 hypothetical protein ULVI_09830 [Cochleicola gelatinilyticus]